MFIIAVPAGRHVLPLFVVEPTEGLYLASDAAVIGAVRPSVDLARLLVERLGDAKLRLARVQTGEQVQAVRDAWVVGVEGRLAQLQRALQRHQSLEDSRGRVSKAE